MIFKGGIEVGAVLPTKNGNVVVTKIIDSTNVQVCFLDNIFETTVRAGHLRNGVVKNPFFPSVFNVGFIGIGKHKVSNKSKATKVYNIWHAMLQRVYNPDIKMERHYQNCVVNTDWHNFQTFADWYITQSLKFTSVNFSWDLDKDLLVPGNREYGPTTCCLVPRSVNVLLLDSKSARGEYPIGVSKDGACYAVKCSSLNKKGQYVGHYPTIRSAQEAYWSAKFQAVRNAAIMYWNYLPEQLAMRLIRFGWEDAFAYYGDDARLWSDNEGVK